MRHSDNDNLSLAGTIEYIERESLKNELARSVFGKGVAGRSLRDPDDGIVNSVSECCGA